MPQNILMPALSAGMEEGTIARWLKAEGDAVEVGEIIAEIETDKATLEMESTHSGVLGTILVANGRTVPVNTTIGLLHLKDESAPLAGTAAKSESVTAGPMPSAASLPPTSTLSAARDTSAATPNSAGRVASSPLARRVAQAMGVSIEGLGGSGPGGRVVRKDVEAVRAADIEINAAEAAGTAGSAPRRERSVIGAHRRVPNSKVRKIIARRLTESKAAIPHFYLNVECEIDALLELRKTLNDRSTDSGKLSVNDFVVKAAAEALRKVPEANATWTDEAVLLYDDVDVSVAVATDGGLLTPVVRNADRKQLSHLSQEIRSLAERARANKLLPEEYQGGSFTVSNLGMYGVHSFSAIINPPQSCILAVGAGERRATVRGDNICVPATVMSCTLSVDHRSVDGAVGARYLAEFKGLIEQPSQLARQEKSPDVS